MSINISIAYTKNFNKAIFFWFVSTFLVIRDIYVSVWYSTYSGLTVQNML